ncbi:MAG: ferrous iron transporter B, partial [Ruminococcus sp.]
MEIRIGLAGNPNCGKTTFFNILTGSNQYVGNWPGVTVEKKEGKVKGREDVSVTDLPGIYSLSPYTPEEIVARNYLVVERPDVILNIVDGTNIERNLYLSLQLIETGIPVVMAINMMDVVRKNGDKINIELLSKRLGIPIVEVSALKNQGVDEAVDLAVKTATDDNVHIPVHRFSGPVEHALAHIEEAVIHEIPEEQQRYLAVKIFEGDKEVLKTLGIENNVLNHIKKDIKICEAELDDDAESIIISERYDYITEIVGQCCKKVNVTTTTSYKLDKILTGKFTGLPIFALIMFGVYYVSVTLIGTSVTDWVNDVLFGQWICGGVSSFLTYIGCADWLISMICDGILGGVGSVIGFAPQMAILFFFLSFLEDCGYMTRIA